MFDLRYHVASLAAVFLALIVGIVVGVGLAGSGVTKEADLKVARQQRDDAQKRADQLLSQLQDIGKSEEDLQNAFELAYPWLMRNLLTEKRIAVLFVGRVDGGVSQAIERTLTDAGADPPMRVVSLKVPVDAQQFDTALDGKGPRFAQYVGDDRLESLGAALATEFHSGGPTPLWKILGPQLILQRVGETRRRADGVVVVRTVRPQQGETARFLRGLFTGLATAGVPSVGVEESGTTPSAADVFHDRGLSSVDDIDLIAGRAALALLLAGAPSGRYGTADGEKVLPTYPGG